MCCNLASFADSKQELMIHVLTHSSFVTFIETKSKFPTRRLEHHLSMLSLAAELSLR
jgi:hypothetical protein